MTRRHFLSAPGWRLGLALPAMSFANALAANANDLKKRHKAAILLVDGGRPGHDRHLGPQARRPDRRAVPADRHLGDEQICEHLPLWPSRCTTCRSSAR